MNFEGDELLEEEEDDEESDEEEETESSIDLLVRFVQSMFKKVSKRARKATRSVLPDVISPQLVNLQTPSFISFYYTHNLNNFVIMGLDFVCVLTVYSTSLKNASVCP